jgi:hypothetical protein
LFSLDASKAWQEYDKAWKSGKAQKTTGSGEGHYGIAGGAFDFTHSYDRQLSQTDFEKKFSEAKEERRKNAASSSSKDTSMISQYQSSVRDSTSIKAWEHCMTTKYPEPGLFAYGYRDASANPYIVVIWAPGTFAAANPVINVKFGLTEAGMTIEGAGADTQIATGSGAAFPLRFTDPNDRKAKADGFAVLVNGELKSGERLIQSFRAEATVPRNLGPMPCSMVFAANKAYQIGVFDTKARNMNWGLAEIHTMGQGPTDRQAGAVVYGAKLTMQGQAAPVRVRLTGTEVVVIAEGDRVFLTGQCTGESVRARLSGTRFTQTPEVTIRPR